MREPRGGQRSRSTWGRGPRRQPGRVNPLRAVAGHALSRPSPARSASPSRGSSTAGGGQSLDRRRLPVPVRVAAPGPRRPGWSGATWGRCRPASGPSLARSPGVFFAADLLTFHHVVDDSRGRAGHDDGQPPGGDRRARRVGPLGRAAATKRGHRAPDRAVRGRPDLRPGRAATRTARTRRSASRSASSPRRPTPATSSSSGEPPRTAAPRVR